APASASQEVNKRRVQDQLRLAQQKLKQGQVEEATRIAVLASRMAREWKLSFGPEELSPAKVLAEVSSTPAGATGDQVPARSAELAKNAPEFTAPPSKADADSNAPLSASEAKAKAAELLAAARQAAE